MIRDDERRTGSSRPQLFKEEALCTKHREVHCLHSEAAEKWRENVKKWRENSRRETPTDKSGTEDLNVEDKSKL